MSGVKGRSRPAVPKNPEYFRIFPIPISHVTLFSCPTNILPRKLFLSGKCYLGMRCRIDKKILFRYFYLHLQNRAYYSGTPPASIILKLYSNNVANSNIYDPYRQVSPRFPTYSPLYHDSNAPEPQTLEATQGPTSPLSRFPKTRKAHFPLSRTRRYYAFCTCRVECELQVRFLLLRYLIRERHLGFSP